MALLFVVFDVVDVRSGISVFSSLNESGRVELSFLLVLRLLFGVDESRKPCDAIMKLLEVCCCCFVSRDAMDICVVSVGASRRERLDFTDDGTLSNRFCFLNMKGIK